MTGVTHESRPDEGGEGGGRGEGGGGGVREGGGGEEGELKWTTAVVFRVCRLRLGILDCGRCSQLIYRLQEESGTCESST
jgi:hypothetical protein